MAITMENDLKDYIQEGNCVTLSWKWVDPTGTLKDVSTEGFVDKVDKSLLILVSSREVTKILNWDDRIIHVEASENSITLTFRSVTHRGVHGPLETVCTFQRTQIDQTRLLRLRELTKDTEERTAQAKERILSSPLLSKFLSKVCIGDWESFGIDAITFNRTGNLERFEEAGRLAGGAIKTARDRNSGQILFYAVVGDGWQVRYRKERDHILCSLHFV